jgi:hypothetical protein
VPFNRHFGGRLERVRAIAQARGGCMLRLRRGLLVVALSLYAASASALSFTLDAIPGGPVISGNGQLEFSNFQFFSPFSSVLPSQVTATILADGIQLSGPITSTSGLKSFSVLYEVRSLGGGIEEASLLLDSDVDADDGFGVVLSTKQILGEVLDEPPGCVHCHKKKDDGFGFGLDLDSSFPTDREILAFLKTADWEIDDPDSCFRTPLGLGSDGAIRLVEGGFDPQPSIRVVDHVAIAAFDGTATWESSTNRFTLVPEPGTASLMLLGFVWVALLSSRRR